MLILTILITCLALIASVLLAGALLNEEDKLLLAKKMKHKRLDCGGKCKKCKKREL